jgi:hypothetical protein
VTTANVSVAPSTTKSGNGIRTNAFSAAVMLLLEFSLGVGVNLFATLPHVERGKTLFTAFGSAVTGGPVVLAVHALLGSALLITAVSAVVRASLIRQPALILLTVIAFLGIVAAWLAGARFVDTMANASSMTMAVASAVSILCYALILFIDPGATTDEGVR